ncbi:MAG: penicillin-binding protein 1C [Leptolyngbyaceae bacterium]|nr:penicillin-binding protein 1C [Leptolyngbyaceae bacterium]
MAFFVGAWSQMRSTLGQGRFHSLPRPILIGVMIVGMAGVGRSLPYLAPIRATDLAQVDEAVTVSDRHGQPLGTLLSRDQDHTMVVDLADISPVFIQAMLAAEDGRYYHHGPLDLRAMVRASYNSARAGRIVSGASTITMQLARMIHPSPRTVGGKVAEIWTAWRLAAGMNRDEILAAYVNRIPMGSNIYGVEAASLIYFGVSSRDLTVAQASILAALPNNPTYLNPYYYWEVLKERQRYVLDQMVQDGWITAAEGDRAFTTELTLHPRQYGIQAAPHFLFWVAEQLPADHPPAVQTTLDRDLQQFVQTQVTQVVRSLADHNVQQGAAIAIDNHSGEVLAYVGAVDYFDHRRNGQNDGVQALRQPGSTLKPFLYELALEQNQIRPNTILADVPTYYPIPGAQLYNPTDYDGTFQGPVRVRLALANSLNVPAVRVLERVGVPPFLQRLHDLGFSHLDQSPEHYGLGLALGSGEVSLWELAQAYLTMAHQGQVVPLKVLSSDEVVDSGQNLLSTTDTATTWALVTDMLSDRHARARSFGVDSVLSLPFDAAVKTGTSSNYRDTWTVGFTRDYTVATWVGNFDGTPMRQVSGVTGAAPLWNRIMLHLHSDQDPAPLPPPSELAQRPICALSGLKPTAACPTVVEEYFYPEDLATYEQEIDTVYQPVTDTRGNVPNYRLNLPAEYDEWLAQQASPAFPLEQLRIVSPLEGDRFLLPSTYTPGRTDPHQRLAFKVAGLAPGQSVEWWLNGDRLDRTADTSASYFWPLQPGVWTLEVRQGEQRDRVRFEVGINDGVGSVRGFGVD